MSDAVFIADRVRILPAFLYPGIDAAAAPLFPAAGSNTV
jgi:hypothetical protein